MSEMHEPQCPECVGDGPSELHRRDFLRAAGGATAAIAVAGAVPAVATAAAAPRTPKPAEELIRELYKSLSADQKEKVVKPWDHKDARRRGRLTRLEMYNEPIFKGNTIGSVYTKPQQELVEKIVRAIGNGEDGYRCLSRGGTWDGSRSLRGVGAYIFGDPSGTEKFSWVLAGHHLTVRCDGNSEDGAAFGGPMYYGHTPNGYSRSNVFFYQTQSVMSLYEALTEEQRKKATVKGSPGEGEGSVRFKKAGDRPGIPAGDLSKDQKTLVETVMRSVLSPYRKEDVDEVFAIIKKNGGLEKIQLAFYPDSGKKDKEPWHFWRMEGPGFVWNFRVLPHVHTYVNISSKV